MIQDLYRDMSIRFEKEGELKEHLENAQEYINLLEQDNQYLNA